jgi:hypothetical protein
MRRYKYDPHWITAKFKGDVCVRCKRPIHPGGRTFDYADDRSLYCETENCGKAADRDFSVRAFDEEHNTSM